MSNTHRGSARRSLASSNTKKSQHHRQLREGESRQRPHTAPSGGSGSGSADHDDGHPTTATAHAAVGINRSRISATNGSTAKRTFLSTAMRGMLREQQRKERQRKTQERKQQQDTKSQKLSSNQHDGSSLSTSALASSPGPAAAHSIALKPPKWSGSSPIRPLGAKGNRTAKITSARRKLELADDTSASDPEEDSAELMKKRKYWTGIVDNVKRAIGMMYDACEMELDIDQCKEAMFIYEKAHADFSELIKRIEEQQKSVDGDIGSISWSVSITRSFPSSPSIATKRENHSSEAKTHQASLSRQRVSEESISGMDHSGSAPLVLSTDNLVEADEIAKDLTGGLAWADVSMSPPRRKQSPTKQLRTTKGFEIHEKLSSPERASRPSPSSLRQLHEEKLSKAEWKRSIMEFQKKEKIRKSHEKIKTAKERQQALLEQKRIEVESKLQKAQANKQRHLERVVESAKEEIKKVEEVLFINREQTENRKYLIEKKLEESENRRIESLEAYREKRKEDEQREQQVRQKRAELENLKRQSIKERNESRQEKQARIREERERQQELRQQRALAYEEKVKRASEKRRREVEAMSKSLDEKLAAGAERKQEKLQMRIEKASAEFQKVRDASKLRKTQVEETGCSVIENPLPIADSMTSKHEQEKRKKNLKKIRKRLEKLRSQISSSNFSEKLSTDGADTRTKSSSSSSSSSGPRSAGARVSLTMQSLRSPSRDTKATSSAVNDLKRIIDTGNPHELQLLVGEGAIDKLAMISTSGREGSNSQSVIQAIESLCIASQSATSRLVFSLAILQLVNRLAQDLLDGRGCLPQLMHIISHALRNASLPATLPNASDISQKFKQGVVQYIYASGVISSVLARLLAFRGNLDAQSCSREESAFIVYGVALLECVTHLQRPTDSPSAIVTQSQRTPSQVTSKHQRHGIHSVDLSFDEHFGVITLLSNILLSEGPLRRGQPMPAIPPTAMIVAISVFKIMENMAHIDLEQFQTILGQQHSNEFVHLLSHVLAFCVQRSDPIQLSRSGSDSGVSDNTAADSNASDPSLKQELLDEVILVIGYFTVGNAHNQSVLQWAKSPTILQRLCMLPFPYYHDRVQRHILLPTLISACVDNVQNRGALEGELSLQIISSYLGALRLGDESPAGTQDVRLPRLEFAIERRLPVDLLRRALEFFDVAKRDSGVS